MKILITGGSGYVGSMLTHQLSRHSRVEKIYVIDVKKPKFLWKENKKIRFINKNLIDDWEKDIEELPEIIIHLAFHIRRAFWPSRLKKNIFENRFGFEKLLTFAQNEEIRKVIVSSSIAVYGARRGNDPTKPFSEDDDLRESEYLYGIEKIEMEKIAENFFLKDKRKKMVILRLATISGPFAQKIYKKGGLLNFLKNISPLIPLISEKSLRQYVHEDDVIEVIKFLIFNDFSDNYLVLNVAPDDFLYFSQIANLLGKKVIRIPYNLAKMFFLFFWYFSLGKIPTAPGSVNSYVFPIRVSNERIKSLGFKFKYTAKDAFWADKGRYLKLLTP